MCRIRIPLLLLLLIWPAIIFSQVSSQGVETITGTVTFRGAIMPGVKVTVTNDATGTSLVTQTDNEGRFVLPALPPGQYVIRVSAQGFKVYQQKFAVTVGALMRLDIELSGEGPIPVGQGGKKKPGSEESKGHPQPRTDTSAPVNGSPGERKERPVERKEPQTSRTGASRSKSVAEVVEETFVDEAGIKQWLDEQRRQGKMLLAIVPLGDTTSLFILARGRRSASVVSVIQTLGAEDLQARINQERKRVFVGLHRLTGSSYLMVFRDGK